MTKSLKKKIGGQIWIFVEVIFFDPSESGFFWTLMESNAAVTLQFEELAVKMTCS